jgi:hypothetical protein
LLDELADDIPPEWYGREMSALRHLLQEIERRRQLVRASLWTTRSGSPQCFPNWTPRALLRHQPQPSETMRDRRLSAA